jgi:hypothetical protein
MVDQVASRVQSRDLALAMIFPPRRSAYGLLIEDEPTSKRRELEPAVGDVGVHVDAAFEALQPQWAQRDREGTGTFRSQIIETP